MEEISDPLPIPTWKHSWGRISSLASLLFITPTSVPQSISVFSLMTFVEPNSNIFDGRVREAFWKSNSGVLGLYFFKIRGWLFFRLDSEMRGVGLEVLSRSFSFLFWISVSFWDPLLGLLLKKVFKKFMVSWLKKFIMSPQVVV